MLLSSFSLVFCFFSLVRQTYVQTKEVSDFILKKMAPKYQKFVLFYKYFQYIIVKGQALCRSKVIYYWLVVGRQIHHFERDLLFYLILILYAFSFPNTFLRWFSRKSSENGFWWTFLIIFFQEKWYVLIRIFFLYKTYMTFHAYSKMQKSKIKLFIVKISMKYPGKVRKILLPPPPLYDLTLYISLLVYLTHYTKQTLHFL